jgi:predicted ATPase/DNA-binding CsgD family transcriptional regulator
MARTAGVLRRFPLGLSSLVGREREVGELKGFVLGCPLVTVTGPGGVGKTRLAVEVGRAVWDEFPDGVHFVGLGHVTESSRVAAEVAAALGVPQAPGAAPGETLAVSLAAQRLLLVLDNCEQVAAGVAELCPQLLAEADDLRILATSREQLWVDGEVRYRLSPLSLPGSGQSREVERSAAVALFVERARQAVSAFVLTEASAPLAVRVVTRLDGMPLAIELAAARMEALGLPRLADRIDDALNLLEGGDARAAGRHRSLAAAAEWSYRLLPEVGRRVFRRLAVFPGPFTLEAAEIVAGPGAEAVVLQLVDCSLVTPPRPGADGRMRYSLLQTLRDYGRSLLAGAEEEEEARAMAALSVFAVAVAGRGASGLATSEDDRELAALRLLDAEDATLAAALDWALDHDPQAALALAVDLAPWWIVRGRAAEGYTRLAAAVAADHRVPAGNHRAADAQLQLGDLAAALGDNGGSAAHYSLAWEVASDPLSRTAVVALGHRATSRSIMGQSAEAAEDARRALALARQSGDRPAQVDALLVNGSHAAYVLNDHEQALVWYQQAADLATAEVPGRRVRSIRRMQAYPLMMLGRYDAARQLWTADLAWCRDAGELAGLADVLAMCIYLEDLAGNTGAMAAHLHEAVDLNVRTGRRERLVECVDEGAFLCAATGRPAEAVTLWAVLTAEFESGAPQIHDERRPEFLRRAEAALTPTRLAAMRERGSLMTITAAAEFVALLTTPASADPASADPEPADSLPPASRPSEAGKLTPRERELVTLVAQGRTNAEIAGQLFISTRTVASHLNRIRAKTGARRRADLTRLALRESLI